MKAIRLLALASMFSFSVIPLAQGGVIRHAGKQIAEQAQTAGQTVEKTGAAAAAGASSAGRAALAAAGQELSTAKNKAAGAAGGASAATVKAVNSAGNDAQSAPGAVVTAARKVWHYLW